MKDKRNSFWLALQFSITLLVALVNLKINLLRFGSEIFGLWIMLASVWGIGTALDFGFGTSVVKYVAEFIEHDTKRLNKFLTSSLIVFSIIGFVIFIGGNIAIYFIYFSSNKLIPTEFFEEARRISFILGLSFILRYLTLFFKSIFEGLNNFVLTSKINIIQNVLLFTSVLIVFLLKWSILSLTILLALSYLIILFIHLIMLKKLYPDFKFRFKWFSKSEVKSILSFSFSVQAVSIFNALIDPTIKYIVGNYYEISYVSIYEIARRFAIAVSQMFFTIFRTILPKASVLRSSNDIKSFFSGEVVKVARVGIIYSGAILGIGSIVFAIVIKYWFNYEAAILIFLILALPESINNFGYSIYMTIMGLGKAYFLAFIQLTNLIVVIASMVAGFVFFSSSLAFLGYFVSVLIGNILMLIFIKNKYSVNIVDFLKDCHIEKLLIHCFMLVLAILGISLYSADYALWLAIVSIVSLVIFYRDIKIYIKKIWSFLRQDILTW